MCFFSSSGLVEEVAVEIPGCPKCKRNFWSFEPFRAFCMIFGQRVGSAHLGIALSVLGNIFLWMESE